MSLPSRPDMENLRPPVPRQSADAPTAAVIGSHPSAPSESAATLRAGSIEKAAARFVLSCDGGDSYANNCAHYLSNAFLLSGSSDLVAPNDCIDARCGTAKKRPIRARDMHCWFQEKATKTSRTMVKNDGFWSVFQLNESEYWGGHVAIIDSDTWKYYGTGWYEEWEQYWYQW